MKNNIATAEEILNEKVYITQDDIKDVHDSVSTVIDAMIQFAKLHVEKIRDLQQAKYYAGETGYIKKDEWEELLTNIK
jgi:hypothetical protein